MAIEFSFEKRGGILFVKAWGADQDMEDVIRYSHAVIEKSRQEEITRVICDERNLEYRISLIDQFELAADLPDMVPYYSKIALIGNIKNEKALHFWETVATNRGLNARVFYDPLEAEKWI